MKQQTATGLGLTVLRPCYHHRNPSTHRPTDEIEYLTVVAHFTENGPEEPELHPVDGDVCPTPASPPVALRRQVIGEDAVLSLVHLIPGDDGTLQPVTAAIASGNYAVATDSRFLGLASELTGSRFYGAVAIHDRL